jgi:hypothetical protein
LQRLVTPSRPEFSPSIPSTGGTGDLRISPANERESAAAFGTTGTDVGRAGRVNALLFAEEGVDTPRSSLTFICKMAK